MGGAIAVALYSSLAAGSAAPSASIPISQTVPTAVYADCVEPAVLEGDECVTHVSVTRTVPASEPVAAPAPAAVPVPAVAASSATTSATRYTPAPTPEAAPAAAAVDDHDDDEHEDERDGDDEPDDDERDGDDDCPPRTGPGQAGDAVGFSRRAR